MNINTWFELSWNQKKPIQVPQCSLNGASISDHDLNQHITKWHEGLSDLNFNAHRIEQTSQLAVIYFNASGQHTGILLSQLPSKKEVTFSGIIVIKFNNNIIQQIDVFEDTHLLRDELRKTSHKTYTPEDFPHNTFDGPAGKLYQAILTLTSPPCGIDQHIVNTFRYLFSHVNEDYLPDPATFTFLFNNVSSKALSIPVKDATITLQWYQPTKIDSNAPIVLYFHGGGWVMGSPDRYDLVCRKLADTAKAHVFCPNYRLAPEYAFPTYFDDCFETYLWLRKNLFALGLNSQRLIVGGDSAGGTITGGLVHYCKDHQHPLPDALLFLSPASDLCFENYPTYLEKSQPNLMLSFAAVAFQRAAAFPYEVWKHPYYSPAHGNLDKFPPSLVMIGEDDPLAEENHAFVAKLNASHVPVTTIIGKQLPHAYHLFMLGEPPADEAFEHMALLINNKIE